MQKTTISLTIVRTLIILIVLRGLSHTNSSSLVGGQLDTFSLESLKSLKCSDFYILSLHAFHKSLNNLSILYFSSHSAQSIGNCVRYSECSVQLLMRVFLQFNPKILV